MTIDDLLFNVFIFRIQNNASMALGFQLHFTDLYLEELAKASKITECHTKIRYVQYTSIT